MKVISPKEMGRIERLAYDAGASEEAFMQQAGRGVAAVVDRYIQREGMPNHVILLCGKGNNAGDAYVAGCALIDLNYEVIGYQLAPIDTCSPLCQKQYQNFLEKGGRIQEIRSIDDFILPRETVFVDGIFGTGFHGQLREPFASIIEAVNLSKRPVIAIDIPSGLNGENGVVEGGAIRAAETVFLGLPKTGFFLQHGLDQTGVLRYVDFGLGEEFINRAAADLVLVTTDRVRSFLPPIKRTRHKYEAGHVVALAGSPSMPGAAILASKAAMRGGAGILHLLHPKGMEGELGQLSPEIIRIGCEKNDVDFVLSWLNRASACLIGPGIGRESGMADFLGKILRGIEKPVVIDADALSLIAEYQLPLPEKTVLTPHTGEMHRLLHKEGKETVDSLFLKECQAYANQHHIALVLKGAATFIFYPDEPVLVNATSDPGMATAGSGDVLTGLIAALLSQHLSLHQAAALGVHLHGLSGVLSAKEKTSYGVIASDLIEALPKAFQWKSNIITHQELFSWEKRETASRACHQ